MPPIRNFQHRPANGTLLQQTPHPSGGRGFWYSDEFREAVMHTRDQGQHRTPLVTGLQQIRLWPSRRTVRRWRRRRNTEGHFRPYRRTGNRRATVLHGIEAVQLAYVQAVYPRITAHEMNVFLYNANGQVRFYHPSQIYRAQQRLGLSKKRASTTARQASLPINIQRRWDFWNLPYPFGVANIRTEDMIDLDEAAVFAETANRSEGKCHLTTRCRDDGIYGHSVKTNVLAAISGERPT